MFWSLEHSGKWHLFYRNMCVNDWSLYWMGQKTGKELVKQNLKSCGLTKDALLDRNA